MQNAKHFIRLRVSLGSQILVPLVWVKEAKRFFSYYPFISLFLLSGSQRSNWSCCRYLEQSETFFTSLTFKVSEHMGQTDSVSKSLKQTHTNTENQWRGGWLYRWIDRWTMDGWDLLGELRIESREITVWADTPILLDQVTTLKIMTHTSIRLCNSAYTHQKVKSSLLSLQSPISQEWNIAPRERVKIGPGFF